MLLHLFRSLIRRNGRDFWNEEPAIQVVPLFYYLHASLKWMSLETCQHGLSSPPRRNLKFPASKYTKGTHQNQWTVMHKNTDLGNIIKNTRESRKLGWKVWQFGNGICVDLTANYFSYSIEYHSWPILKTNTKVDL